jgi:hypothetical protein
MASKVLPRLVAGEGRSIFWDSAHFTNDTTGDVILLALAVLQGLEIRAIRSAWSFFVELFVAFEVPDRLGLARGGAMVIDAQKVSHHPAVLRFRIERAESLQNRIADSITAFAGSMWFVYLHIAWFTAWIVLGIEKYPYGLLTMIVSLEAIFLSTFVLISQNRQDQARSHLADEQWRTVQMEERQNEELIELTKQILALTKALHERS